MVAQETYSPAVSSEWFDNLIAEIKSHQLMYETNTLSEDKKKLYEVVLSGNADKMAELSKYHAQQHFVSSILIDYIKCIKNFGLTKLAFDYNDSEVLVWAEILNDREDIERELILAEAQVNAKFHPFGFDMNSTIVEQNDYMAIPNHYKTVIG